MVTWKNRSYYKGIDAEKVYQEIDSLGENYTPEQVVNFARNPDSELHKCFEWDDSEAAEEWRKQQARVVFANLVVVVEREEQEPTAFRLFQSQGRGHGYAKSTIISRDVDAYAELLNRALAELDAFRKRYENIAELQQVIDAIEELIA